MYRRLSLFLLAALISFPAFSQTKLSQINNGGALNVSTDQVVGVRSGATDELLSLSSFSPPLIIGTTPVMGGSTGAVLYGTGGGLLQATNLGTTGNVLINTGGTPNWSQSLFDTSGDFSIAMTNRMLYESAANGGGAAIDYTGMLNPSDNLSFDSSLNIYVGNLINDLNAVGSVDPNNRLLYEDDGASIAIDYSGNLNTNAALSIASSDSQFNGQVATTDGSIAPAFNSQFEIDLNNMDYLNATGANSHIFMNNINATGQNVVSSFIGGAQTSKWRTDFQGTMNWVAGDTGTTGAHVFYVGGDDGVGNSYMAMLTSGNILMGSGVNENGSDNGNQLQVSGAITVASGNPVVQDDTNGAAITGNIAYWDGSNPSGIGDSGIAITGTLHGSGGTPTCGSGCASITSGSIDVRGSATTGTLANSMVVNFSTTLASVPFCTVSGSTTTATIGYTATTSALTINLSSGLTGDVITWICPL